MKTLKKYTTPKMEIMDMGVQPALLSGSGDNPYWQGEWEGPETPEGCDNAWHC